MKTYDILGHLRKRRRHACPPAGPCPAPEDKPLPKVQARLYEYAPDKASCRVIDPNLELPPKSGHQDVFWLDVDGVHDRELLRKIGERYGLHPLILEDIARANHRPKLEEMEDYLFLTLKMLMYDETEQSVRYEQVSFILGQDYLISFQENILGDVFDEVRLRLTAGKGRLRAKGPDALLHALLDAIVDNYFSLLEKMGDDIEDVEERLLGAPTRQDLEGVHALRRQALYLRKFVWPLREVVAKLEKGGSELIRQETIFYLRDLYDHLIQVMDTIETFRDVLSGLAELYLSNISLKLNEIMKVLTMISVFFMPLSFIAGFYGMNFKHMPELDWDFGYYGVIGLMLAISLAMLTFFKKKKWL